mgnify:FL=1
MKNKGQKKVNFIWNSIAGLINAGESVLILMVCTRTAGLETAGILTIAFAIANLVMAIGKFGMRTYQVTDAVRKFDETDYFSSRVLTVTAMILISGILESANYVRGTHTFYKAMAIFLLCVIYAVESVEDVFAGMLQKINRLDIGSKIFIIRWIGILSLFLVGLCQNVDLLKIEVGAIIFSIVIDAILIKKTFAKVHMEKVRFETKKVHALILTCMPLFLVAFLSLYLTNAPKYAIDAYMSSEVQAKYGFISMPVFVISLLNSFLYQPLLVEMSLLWDKKDVNGLRKIIRKQIKWIGVLTVCIMIGAYVVGIPALEWLYHAELNDYRVPFLILMIGGGLLAIVGYESVVLTIMRYQKQVLIGYAVVTGIGALLFGKCVLIYGILGSVVFYDGLMLMLVYIFGICIARDMKSA